MKQLEVRFYGRAELAEVLQIDVKNKNFARQVKNKLMNWGYSFEYSRKGVNIIRQPQTAQEKLAEIMIRKYDLDIQIDTTAFACFLTAFFEVDGFNAMPWAEREKILKEIYDVSVDERTLRNWCSKLIKTNTIYKDNKEKTYWCTTVFDGVKKRELVNEEEMEELKQYWEYRHKFLDNYISSAIASGRKDYKAINAEARKEANKALWREFGCCYYSCKTLLLSAFDDISNLEEIYDLIKEIIYDDEYTKVEITIKKEKVQDNLG